MNLEVGDFDIFLRNYDFSDILLMKYERDMVLLDSKQKRPFFTIFMTFSKIHQVGISEGEWRKSLLVSNMPR